MAFDLNSIGSLLSGGGVEAIAKRVNLNREDVAKVLSQGLPALVNGMRRNAGAKEGAASLSKALADHSADDVSNPGAFLQKADLQDGKKILAHVLGGDKDAVLGEISKASGVTKAKTTSILSLAAPLLLSLLGQNNSAGSANSGGLLGLLGGLLGGSGSSGSGSGSSGGGLLGGLLGGGSNSGGLLSSLLGGNSGSSSQSGGLLDNVLNLFH